jgi:hypothetical protein
MVADIILEDDDELTYIEIEPTSRSFYRFGLTKEGDLVAEKC